MWLLILLILLLRPFIKGTFEYEKITRKEMVILPVYSLIMMLVSLDTHMNLKDILLTFLLLILGIFIGWLQARGVSIQDKGKTDQYGRPIIKIKRNWPYLIGWIIIFILNIGLQIYFGKNLSTQTISSSLAVDLLKDVSTGFFIFWHSEWFVWVLTVASTLGYRVSIIRKDPRIKQAVGIKEKRQQILTQKELKRMGKSTREKDK
ncbi:hydrophobic protein [Lactobacillus johnsonii]|uniref:hydrophobic protein n=1 Tax=Lactobacillus johnsonii TaxID=33959 RepID=UPI003D77417B